MDAIKLYLLHLSLMPGAWHEHRTKSRIRKVLCKQHEPIEEHYCERILPCTAMHHMRMT